MLPLRRENIKVIGFDLDQTLYPKSPSIDSAIQQYIYETISAHKKCTLGESKKLFSDLYKNGSGLSGRKTLIALGIPDAKNIIQKALEIADISEFLIPNNKHLELLKQLSGAHKSLDIITGSTMDQTISKLEALEIPKDMFAHIVTADYFSKSDGSAYEEWLSFYPDLKPSQFVYIGDRPVSDYEIPREFGIPSILVNVDEQEPDIKCLQLSSLLEIKEYLL